MIIDNRIASSRKRAPIVGLIDADDWHPIGMGYSRGIEVVIALVLALIKVELPGLCPCGSFGWWVGVYIQMDQVPADTVAVVDGRDM